MPLVLRPVLAHKRGLAVFAQQAGRHRHGTARIRHMHHRLTVMRGNLDRGVGAAGGGATDQQRHLEAWRSSSFATCTISSRDGVIKSAQTNACWRFLHWPGQDLLGRHHDAQVDHFIVIAGKHHADDIFADIVHIAFDRREHDLALRLDRLPGRRERRLLCSMYGVRCATAFFITRALLTTCGRNILPAPNRSPTTLMPSISGPSITSNGRPSLTRASSASSRCRCRCP